MPMAAGRPSHRQPSGGIALIFEAIVQCPFSYDTKEFSKMQAKIVIDKKIGVTGFSKSIEQKLKEI